LGIELHYYADQDYFITFTSAGSRYQVEHVNIVNGTTNVYRNTIGPESLIFDLGCK
jgi:hypothetical protein